MIAGCGRFRRKVAVKSPSAVTSSRFWYQALRGLARSFSGDLPSSRSQVHFAVRVGTARDAVSLQPGSEASKPMPEAEVAKAMQLLDLMLEFFTDDGHWTRGRYDDGNGGHCL